MSELLLGTGLSQERAEKLGYGNLHIKLKGFPQDHLNGKTPGLYLAKDMTGSRNSVFHSLSEFQTAVLM